MASDLAKMVAGTEWTVSALARTLGVDRTTLYRWAEIDNVTALAVLEYTINFTKPGERQQPDSPVVYFIRCGDKVKIGKAALGSLTSRLQALQIGNPFELEIMGIIPGGNEGDLHERFAGHRVRGEWFNLDPEIRDYVLQYCCSAATSK